LSNGIGVKEVLRKQNLDEGQLYPEYFTPCYLMVLTFTKSWVIKENPKNNGNFYLKSSC